MQRSSPPRKLRNGTLVPIAECITLDTLAERARGLDLLDGKLRHLLPDSLARECHLADLRNERLVFIATSSTWATRLRLHQGNLMTEARAATGNAVEHFAVKVAPLPLVPSEPARAKPLSTTAANHLRSAAKTIADPELQDLYLKLASLASSDYLPEA
ncbi:MAG: DciA family protein [Dokdonella sp.]